MTHRRICVDRIPPSLLSILFYATFCIEFSEPGHRPPLGFPAVDLFTMTRSAFGVTWDAFGVTWGAVGMTRGGFGVTWGTVGVTWGAFVVALKRLEVPLG